MIDVFKDGHLIGSLLKVTPRSRPWFAYVNPDGRGNNFKSRKEAVAWLEAQHCPQESTDA